jgi:hypothetical protein
MTDVENLTVTLNTNKTNAKETDPQHPTPTPISGYNPYYYLDETIMEKPTYWKVLRQEKQKTSRSHILT